jgi:hypothetical protein
MRTKLFLLLALSCAQPSFGLAVLDFDQRFIQAHRNPVVTPDASFHPLDASSHWYGTIAGDEYPAWADAYQKSSISPEHFEADLFAGVGGKDTASAQSAFDIRFHLDSSQQYDLDLRINSTLAGAAAVYFASLEGVLDREYQTGSMTFSSAGVLPAGDYRIYIWLDAERGGSLGVPVAADVRAVLSLDLSPVPVPDAGSTLFLLVLTMAGLFAARSSFAKPIEGKTSR